MAIHWIKLAVGVFDDEKISVIQSLPEGDAILNIWFRILCLAGKCNDGGLVYLTRDVPYSDETLAAVFHKPVAIVRLALETFDRLGIVTRYASPPSHLFVTNWVIHQNVEGMERSRELSRKRMQKYRERLQITSKNVTVTSRDALDSDSDSDIKKSMSTLTCAERLTTAPAPALPSPESPKKKPRKRFVDPISFDWETYKWDGISDEQVAEWKPIYPAIDIDRELGKAALWLKANPEKSKSRWTRFLVNWFGRAQERGGDKPWKK